MVSLSEFIAVIGVVIAAFGLGYRFGRDRRHDDKTQENSRPGFGQTLRTAIFLA